MHAADFDPIEMPLVGLEVKVRASSWHAAQGPAMAIGKCASNQSAGDQNIETDRCIRVFDALGPAGNQARVHEVDLAAQLKRCLVICLP